MQGGFLKEKKRTAFKKKQINTELRDIICNFLKYDYTKKTPIKYEGKQPHYLTNSMPGN